jgi:hypothetical protein
MSDARTVEFFCPHCKARTQSSFHTRIDAATEPDLSAQLLAGTLSEVTCWHCGERTLMEHSLVYVSRDRSGAIWLDPPNDPLGFAAPPEGGTGPRMRRVRDANALRELATVWRDSLDDRAMLLLKHMLAARMFEETGSAPVLLAYEDRFNEEGQEWLEYVVFTDEEGDPEALRTPVSTYKSVVDALDANREKVGQVLAPGTWVDWNGETARNLWEAL